MKLVMAPGSQESHTADGAAPGLARRFRLSHATKSPFKGGSRVTTVIHVERPSNKLNRMVRVGPGV